MGATEFVIDRAVVARNLRRFRQIRRETQKECAQLAGVDLATIYRIENQKPVRIQTLRKICERLNMSIEQIANPQQDEVVEKGYRFHRPSEKVWFGFIDKRSHRPEENQALIQDSQERLRLGQLGLVGGFLSGLGFMLQRGPGVLCMEIFQETKGVNDLAFRDHVLFCLRGEVWVTASGEKLLLEQYGALAYENHVPVTIRPTKPLKTGETPPLLLWIGANKLGQERDGFRELKRVRKARSKGSP